jgi:hypothetical protein
MSELAPDFNSEFANAPCRYKVSLVIPYAMGRTSGPSLVFTPTCATEPARRISRMLARPYLARFAPRLTVVRSLAGELSEGSLVVTAPEDYAERVAPPSREGLTAESRSIE